MRFGDKAPGKLEAKLFAQSKLAHYTIMDNKDTLTLSIICYEPAIHRTTMVYQAIPKSEDTFKTDSIVLGFINLWCRQNGFYELDEEGDC